MHSRSLSDAAIDDANETLGYDTKDPQTPDTLKKHIRRPGTTFSFQTN
jgi:hypothetical protein